MGPAVLTFSFNEKVPVDEEIPHSFYPGGRDGGDVFEANLLFLDLLVGEHLPVREALDAPLQLLQ